MLSPVGGGDRLLFDPFEVTDPVIDDWEEAGVDVLICPTFCMELDGFGGVVRQLAAWNSVLHDHSDRVMRIAAPGDFQEVRRAGKLGVLISIHYGGNFRTLDDIDYFHRLGQRSSTIVVRGQNAIGCSHHERYESGLSQFGVAAVERMNDVGIAIDIAHANERTSLDVIEASSKPVYVSHANARALCPHEKNKSDEVLANLAAAGGVIAMQPAATLVHPREPVTLAHFIDQIDYVVKLVGPEAVGIGFEEPHRGWSHLRGENSPVESVRFKPGEVPDEKLAKTPTMKQIHIPELLTRDRWFVLADALLEHGYDEGEVRGMLGGNIERLFTDTMRGAKASDEPYESSFRSTDTNIGSAVREASEWCGQGQNYGRRRYHD